MKSHHIYSLIAGMLLTGAAQAQQIVSFRGEILKTSTDWTQTLQLPRFDARLGSLTQVKLSYAGEVWQTLYAENKSPTASTYDLTATATLALSRLSGPKLFAPVPITLHRAGALGAFDGNLDFAGTSGDRFCQDFAFTRVFMDPNLDCYVGSGSIGFIASAVGCSTLISGGNFVKGGSTSAAASLSVEYSYATIPEPSAFAVMLGVAAVGVVALRRRRQS